MDSWPAKFDLVKWNTKLKELIRQRCKDLGYPLFHVCTDADVEYEKAKRYLNVGDPADQHDRIKHAEILRLCTLLGISLRLQIIIKPLGDMPVIEKRKFKR